MRSRLLSNTSNLHSTFKNSALLHSTPRRAVVKYLESHQECPHRGHTCPQTYPGSWQSNSYCCHHRRGSLLQFCLQPAHPWPPLAYLVTQQTPSSVVGSPNPSSQLQQGKADFPWQRATGEEEETVLRLVVIQPLQLEWDSSSGPCGWLKYLETT